MFSLTLPKAQLAKLDEELARRQHELAELQKTVAALQAQRDAQAALIEQMERNPLAPENLMKQWGAQMEPFQKLWGTLPRD